MYAVIETGGKQLRVQTGDIVQIEKVEGEVGTSLQFDQVLFLAKPAADEGQKTDIWLGKPLVDKAVVSGVVLGQGRGQKMVVFKKKRRKDYRRTAGHRQYHTEILITGVDNGSGATEQLSDDDQKNMVQKFRSRLKAKGLARTPKTLGSRKRMAEAKGEEKKAAPKKATASTTAKKTTKKASTAKKKTTTTKKTSDK